MQVVESLDYARGVESRRRIIKVSTITQNCPQLAAQTAFHQHVQVFAIFESLEELHDEVTICLAHDFLLGHDVLLLPGLNDLRLFHLLQRKGAGRVVLDLHQLDATKAADTERGDDSQVSELDFAELFIDSESTKRTIEHFHDRKTDRLSYHV
jgi:hypothetical protein